MRLDQVRAARRTSASPAAHIVLSHVDKVVDRGYHRELLGTGAFAEYDGSFRWGDRDNGTLTLLELGARGRTRIGQRPARHGRRAAGLLRRVRRVARAHLAARRVHALRWARAASTRRPASGCSSTTRRGRSPSPTTRSDAAPMSGAIASRRTDRAVAATGGLLTSVVGSHARPSWFVSGIEAAAARRVRSGRPRRDARRRRRPGAARPGGGRHRRRQRRRDAPRRLLHRRVLPAPDGRPAAAAGATAGRRRRTTSSTGSRSLEPIAAPDGLGVVEEYRYARDPRRRGRSRSRSPGRTRCPGRLTYGPGQVYPHRNEAAEAFVPILRAEIEGLVAAGATFIQIDDPSPAIHPDAPVRLRGPLQRGGRAGRRARPARRPPLLRELPRPAARPADVPAGPRRDARLPTSTSSSSSSRTARWPRSRSSARSPPPGATSPPAIIDVKNSHLEIGRRRRRADRPGPGGRRAARAAGPRARLRVQPDRPLGDDRASCARSWPGATSCSAGVRA